MKIDFTKNENGLIPAIIQDNTTKNVLMLGYMNQEAVNKTLENNKVTFFSRSKNRLWTKGEESGNFLELVSIKNDCGDSIWKSILPSVATRSPSAILENTRCCPAGLRSLGNSGMERDI